METIAHTIKSSSFFESRTESSEHVEESRHVETRSTSKVVSASSSLSENGGNQQQTFEQYVAIVDYKPDGSDPEALAIAEGQVVEVLDSNSKYKWLVRTRNSRSSGKSQGWVPASFLEKKTSFTSSSLKSLTSVTRRGQNNTSISSYLSELEADEEGHLDSKEREAANRRRAVVRELVETEDEFVKDMQKVVNSYLREMDNPRMPKELRDQKDVIFINFKEICDFHNNVLSKGIQYYSTEPSKLAKTFLRLERDFDHHARYCRDEPQAQAVLSSPPVKEYFDEYSKRIGDGDKTLSDHLKLPIQRINDYQLLLRELTKYTARLKEDVGDLHKALDLMLSVPQRAHDLQFLNSIQGYRGNLYKFGRLLRHDWLTVNDSEGRSKERYLFLFKSHILVTKVRRLTDTKSAFILKDIVRLHEVQIENLADSPSLKLHHKQPGFPRYPLTILAKSEFVKEAWLKDIRDSAEELIDLGEEEIEITAPTDQSSVTTSEVAPMADEQATVMTESLRSGSATSIDELEDMKHDEQPAGPCAPEFVIKFHDTELLHGSTVRFLLKIKANPDAQLTFQKDGKNLVVNERTKIQQDDKDTYELVINDVTKDDSGKYTCTAKNNLGSATTACNVIISGDKDVFQGLHEEPPAKRALLDVDGRSTASPCESVDFSWFKDGKEFEASDRFKALFRDDEDSLAVVFQHVTPEDAGLYTCVASTQSGRISCSAELTVEGATYQLSREPEKPTIVAEIQSVECNEGSSAMLETKVSGYPRPTITWTKDSSEIKTGGRYKILREEDDTITLVIKNVTKEDAGKYTLTVKNDLGSAKASGDLLIRAPPKFTKTLQNMTIMTDESVKFEAQIEGKPAPEVSWFKDGQAVHESDRIKLMHDKKEEIYSLLIKKVICEDAGSYSCVASNTVGKMSEFCALTVNDPPKFIKPLKNLEIKEDETLKLEVKVSGFPTPTVSWQRDGQNIKEGESFRIKFEKEEKTHVLVVTDSIRKYAGKYTCIATSASGSASCSGDVVVNAVPAFSKRLEDISVKEGQTDVRLEVKVSGFPKPTITWSIDSTEITSSNNKVKLVDDGETQALIIKKVEVDSAGKYTIKAVNKFEEAKSSSVVNVLTKPKFVEKLSDQEVPDGADVKFSVKVTGNPEPTVAWFKDGSSLQSGGNVKISKGEEKGVYIVNIKGSTKTSAGVYECRATSSEGEAVTKATLIVDIVPTFAFPLKDNTVWVAADAIFDVVAEGIPAPECLWFKKDEQLQENNPRFLFERIGEYQHRLTIKGAIAEDTDKYKVVVKNNMGEAECSAKLTVRTAEDAKEPVVLKKLEDTIVVIAHPLHLEAKVFGNPQPTVSWIKDGVKIEPSERVVFDYNEIKHICFLTIANAVPSDTGTYKVVAANDSGETSTSCAVNVHVPPAISEIKNKKAMPKSNVSFETTVTGIPQPAVHWERNGKKLDDGRRIHVTEDVKNQKYTIAFDDIVPEDTDEYTCVAENAPGKQSLPFRLDVTTEPPKFIKGLSTTAGKLNAALKLTVQVYGLPMPQVAWYKDRVELSNSEKHKIVQEDERNFSLIIDHFNETDVARYRCRAFNGAGEASTDGDVRISKDLPEFLKHVPKEVGAIESEDFVIEAKLDNNPMPTVKWLKDGKPVVPNERIKFQSEPDGTVRLVIENANKEDRGKYTLVASNAQGDQASSCAVSVEAIPKAPAFTKKLSDTEVSEGSPLQLSARISGYPRPHVKWLRDGKPLKTDSRTQFVEKPDGTFALIIDSVRPEDAGRYSLLTSNHLGDAESSAGVIVSGAKSSPLFLDPPRAIDAYDGLPFRIDTRLAGSPLPQVHWKKDGVPLDISDSRYILTTRPDGYTSLQIAKALPSDAGRYTLSASNPVGSISGDFDVTVRDRMRRDLPPMAPTFTVPFRDVYIDEGKPLRLIGQIDANPFPDIEWYRNGEHLRPSDHLSLLFDGKNVTLDIRRASPKDAGSYECRLRNNQGEITGPVKAFVNKLSTQPIFVQRINDLHTIPGGEPRFVCKVSGYPRPDITWYRNGTPVIESDKYRMKRDGDMYWLQIRGAALDDAGTYLAKIKNDEGADECSAKLDVAEISNDIGDRIEAPNFLKKIGDCAILEGMTAKFTACVTGIPEPKFQWYKDGHELTWSGRIQTQVEPHGLLRLLIKDAGSDDVGVYTLKIRNQHGTAECAAQLKFEGEEKRPRSALDHRSDIDHIKRTGIPLALPDKPIISKMGDRRLTLSWKPYIPIGPSPPVTYTVEMCEVPGNNWIAARAGIRGCCCEIRNLEPYRDYRFRIIVENKYGLSDPSPYAQAYRTKLEMSPPKYLPRLPPEFDFRPETSPHFPKDFDFERPPHEQYEHAPRFLRLPDEVQYGIRGQHSSIDWFVYGYPTPTVTFYKDDEKIEMGGRYDSSISRNGRCTLFINKMMERDVGLYECVAVNQHGEARQRIRYEIAELPMFTLPLDETTIILRGSGKLSCRVIGVPYPEIKWYKDWHPIMSTERVKIEWTAPDICTLTISNAITSDCGLYSVTAKNLAGMSSSSAMIFIEENEDDYHYLTYRHSRIVKAKARPMEDFYDVGDELGRGTQGITYHAVERATGKSYAAKTMYGKGHLRNFMTQELDMMNQLHDRYLIRLYDAFETKRSMVLITELASGGELLDGICKKTTYLESEIAYYIRQVLWGLDHMHGKGIGHLGLTPADILLSRPGGDDLKIGDFGLSARLTKGVDYYVKYGMPEFVAPEIVNKQAVSFQTDMWSVGVITYLLLSGISPFLGDNDRETLQRVQKGQLTFDTEIFSSISDEAKDFISKLLVFDASGRMDVKTALNHPWLKWADRPGSGVEIDTERLRNYSRRYRKWICNAACCRWYRRRELETAFHHPSKMVYPPDEEYTPPSSHEASPIHDKGTLPATKPSFIEKVAQEREPIEYDLGYADSNSRYQQGPDTYLLQLRDVGLPMRLREYMRVSANSSPSLALRLQDALCGKMVTVHERRRFTDIMDEEIKDERNGEYGSTRRRLQSEVSPRSETRSRLQELLPSLREAGLAPFFREKIQDQAVAEEQSVQFVCLAIGEPKPTVIWYRNDVIVSESSRLKFLEDDEGHSILQISPARAFDAGVFKAVARNIVGQAICRARLKLGDVPGRVDAPEICQTSDTEILAKWHPPKSDGNSPVLCYSLELKNVEQADWTEIRNNIDHLFFVVRGLQLRNNYQLRVRARNKFGWGEASVPSEVATTIEGAPRVTITGSMKQRQLVSESGREIPDVAPRVRYNYGVERTPIPLQSTDVLEKYSLVSIIHRGRFSAVAKARSKENQQEVAVKLIIASGNNEGAAQQEYETARALCHERLSNLREAYSSGRTVALVQELSPGPDVLTWLCDLPDYNEDTVARIIKQVLDGVEYLHFRGIAHLNLQPDNVIVSDAAFGHVKLVDFGQARSFSQYASLSDQGGRSVEYSAPEILRREDISPQADVWTIGVLCYVLLSGVSPFRAETDEQTAENINYVRYQFEFLYKEVTMEATRFLMLIFKRTPQKRLTIEECHENKWLNPSEYMLKKRERAVFHTNRLRTFAEEYHTARATATPENSTILQALTANLSSSPADHQTLTSF